MAIATSLVRGLFRLSQRSLLARSVAFSISGRLCIMDACKGADREGLLVLLFEMPKSGVQDSFDMQHRLVSGFKASVHRVLESLDARIH